MNNIKHIFFDLDNTLWDHRKNANLTISELFVKEKIKEKYQLNFEQFYPEFFRINEELWAKIRDAKITKDYLRKHRFYDSFLFFGIDDFELSQRFESQFLDEILSHNELVDGSLEVLKYLSEKNYILHIISNGFEDVTHRKMELSGIRKYFCTVTSADEIDIRKPHPEIYSYALKKSDAKIENSIMIGDDWIADVVGALDFGIKPLFFDSLNENPENHKNVIVIKSLPEVFKYL